MVRVVLDTNIVILALIRKGNPKRILELIFSGKATVCLSEATVAKYVEVLSRPKFIRYPLSLSRHGKGGSSERRDEIVLDSYLNSKSFFVSTKPPACNR